MKKRLLSAALAVCMIFGSAAALPEGVFSESTSITASAVSETKKSGDYNYIILDNGTAEITKYNGKADKLTVPSTIGGKKVTSIGKRAFSNLTSLKSINIPNSVKSIGSMAFLGCTSLTSITIPSSVTSIEEGVFYGCSNLTTVNLSKNTEKIGRSAFANTKLTSVSIPYSTSIIGEFAFQNCTSLKDVYIGGGRAKTIENYAFNNCTALSLLNLGTTVSAIGSYAFQNCTSLKTVKIPDSVNGIYQRAFEGCTSLTDVVIGNKVKTIGTGAFIYCKKLKNVAFGVSVESIGDNAFDSCESLDKVVLMPSTKSIGTGAFGGCSAIEYAFMPGVETISSKAFMYCTKLNELYFSGSKIRSIGEEAFINCLELKKIGLPDSVSLLRYYCFGYKKEKDKYIKYTGVNICGTNGSNAQKYAKANGFEFRSTASHSHKNKTVTVPSTCTTKGYQITLCKYCGKTTKSNVKDANGHKWSAWTTTGYDFAKKTSSQSRRCSVCGKTETQTTKNAITCLAGANRYETASIISKKMNPKTSGTVIIATGLTFHDAMVAVPLASAHNAPLLLATEKHITAQTEAELKRLKAKNVIVVSTNGAIGAKAKAEFKAKKLNMTYIEGKNVFETSTKVAKALQTKNKKAPDTIFFATDGAFADALSASPVAAIKGAPIIYLNNKSIDKTVADYLKSVKGKIKNAYIIGGNGVISNAMMKNVANSLGLTVNKTVVRVAGKNRYETCVAVNSKFKSVLSSDGICVAKGLDFPDALAGGVYAASTKQALFLADGKKLQDVQNTYLKSKNAGKITVFGGTGAVPDSLVKLIAKASV